MELALLLCFSAFMLQQVKGNYHFEVRFHSYMNPTNNDWDGGCCDCCLNSCTNDPCEVMFFICLRARGFTPHVSNDCSIGSQGTSGYPLSASSIIFVSGENIAGAVSNPASFSSDSYWGGGFQLMVRVDDDDLDANDLVDRVIADRALAVSDLFTPVQNFLGLYGKVTLQLSFRVTCDNNYYGSDCNKYCVPLNSNTDGHFDCNGNGDRVCTAGYEGADCLIPVCATGCIEGTCSAPGLCDTCNSGWTGSLCDQCQLATECDANRAYCRQPGQCICNVGYSGALCQIDEDVCGHQTPCKNGGSCTNSGPDNYNCQCSTGYTGHDCDVDIDYCASSPCLNAATCLDFDAPATFNCSCATGWTGSLCDDNIDECSLSSPCQNSGTCSDCVPMTTQSVQSQTPTTLPYCPLGYNCTCTEGHYGDNCEADVDYCVSSPCNNEGSCVDIVGGPGYTCICPLEYTGQDCDVEVNECDSSPCLNGATCTDLLGSYSCDCVPGFAGVTCSTDIDECASSPCHTNNTMECSDEIDSFLCICLPGYTGSDCSMVVDECEVFPCANGGTCTAKINDFECQCPSGFTGTRCEINIDNCHPDICLFGGTCVDQVGGYTCLCAPGYTGSQCEETYDLCSSSPCGTNEYCQQSVILDIGFECLPCVAGEADCAVITPGNAQQGNRANRIKMTVGVVVGAAAAIALLVCLVITTFCLVKKRRCCCFGGVKTEEININSEGHVQNNPLYFGASTILSNSGTFNGSKQKGAHATLVGSGCAENGDTKRYKSLDIADSSFTSKVMLLPHSNQCNTFEEEHVYDYIGPSAQNNNNYEVLEEKVLEEKEVSVKDCDDVMKSSGNDDLKMEMKPVQSGKYDRHEENPRLPDPPGKVYNPYTMDPSMS